jgi:N6-L-threonylcarbamoyladenine synthase
MLVLGLESSCDETAAAVVLDGRRVLSDIISSQIDVHARFGGVVPELASRHHVMNMLPVVQAALDDAGLGLGELDAIAVTMGPGLVGALLCAVQLAKALAWARGLPLVGVHHLEGHLAAVHLEPGTGRLAPAGGPAHRAPGFPHLALLVSGGHTSLIVVEAHGHTRELGRTLDDAAGEAFDKVGKLLGLGYPAGAVIDRLARSGDQTLLKLPRPLNKKGDLDFSFSGMKTWMRTWILEHGVPEGQALADVCASFQHAVVTSLVSKTRAAAKLHGLGEVQIAGGVAANSHLRHELERAGAEDGFAVFAATPRRCTDNADMIACAGTHRLRRGERAPLDLRAQASLPLPGLVPA